MTERSGSSRNETHSTRRYWRMLDTPASWWPWGLLPLLALLLLWILGGFVLAPSMEQQIEDSVTARLANYDLSGVASDGQSVSVRLDLADDETVNTASAFAQSTRCQTWAGNLICPTSVRVSSDRVPPKVAAEPIAAVLEPALPDPETVEPAPVEPETVAEPQILDRCNEQFADALSNATIRFRTASAQIADSNDELLNNLAEIARNCPGTLMVEGHTDSVGTAQNNRVLSQARANAVLDALATRGLPTERMRANGYGEDRPIADNTTESGKAQNRRIVIRVTNQ